MTAEELLAVYLAQQQEQDPRLLGRIHPEVFPWMIGQHPAGEGEEHVPPAGWEQQPDNPLSARILSKKQRSLRWGDTTNFTLIHNAAGPAVKIPTLAVLDMTLDVPAVCLVRLSCIDTTGHAIGATDTCQFQVQFGVGQSNQNKFYTIAIGDAAGATDTDKYLTVPIHHLRVAAVIHVTPDPTLDRTFEIVAHVSPYTSLPENIT